MLASSDHQKCKLRAVAGADGFLVAELRVRQLKIGCKSCFVVSADFQTKLGRNFAAIKKTKTNFRKKVEP